MFGFLEGEVSSSKLDLSTRGVLFPFGHRRPDTPVAQTFGRSLPRLIGALQESELAGDFVFRDITADLLSLYARLSDTSTDDAADSLRSAIRIRRGGGRVRPITRTGVEVNLAEDRFLLAHLDGQPELRRLGFVELLRDVGPEDLRPRYLTLLAKEVEDHGPLTGALVPGPTDLAIAIRIGDVNALFEAAAHAAYLSADLTQVNLGGRGGVVTLRDSDGIAGQTFVYKQTTPSARLRDEAFSREVRLELARRKLDSRFGLIDHLTEISHFDGSENSADSVVSVRRFTDGVVLKAHLQGLSAASSVGTLKNVAEFLALIHYSGLGSMDARGTRRALWERETGRWLRAFGLSDEDRREMFAVWWSAVSEALIVPRRDAHPMNWLIGADGQVRAVDLESGGGRPFGYELAQLIEDGQVLPPSDREARMQILEHYRNSWTELFGDDVSSGAALSYFDAGSLARAARAISHPNATSVSRAYGGDLLMTLAADAHHPDLRDVARQLGQRWNRMTGHVASREFQTLSEAGRRRISRAMAYHLRHDSDALVSRAGWIHVDELADQLRASGHKVSSDQLLLIAGALGEPRFELDGEDIRAAYGHSTKTSISYDARRSPRILFHATPTKNLASIFEARAGLKRGQRNWVHLTESCVVAVDAARRQRAAVSVLEIDASTVTGLVHASGVTWLAPEVEVGSIRVLPIRKVRELLSVRLDDFGDPLPHQ
jgi:RNA:NAD 2'-phosphotransferase (TPT1/KptA family)